MEHEWMLVPGIALIGASLVIQFGSYFRRPIPARRLLNAVRLRFLGFGVLLLGIGLDFVLSALFGGHEISLLVVGLVLVGFAGLWFYAASDRIFQQP
jgi:hypothetical protein